jgi:hypothetical protein
MWQTSRQVHGRRGDPMEKQPPVALLEHFASLPDPAWSVTAGIS